jgi:hypothetical protein
MDAAKTVSAVFVADTQTLTTSKTGTGIGEVNSGSLEINCGAICSHAFNDNATVLLTALPDIHSTFTGWSGGGCSGTGTCSVTMDAAKTVSAQFTLNTNTLGVSKSGNGSITSNVGGINCGAGCSSPIGYGTAVTLTATPDAGNLFMGWGGACSGQGTCTLSITANTQVTASFAPGFGLTVSTPVNGSITGLYINCGLTGGNCNASYYAGTQVTLTARPAAGYSFGAWGGACTGVATNTCTVSVDAAKTVSASFTANPAPASYALTVNKTGNGLVSGLKINCGASCTASYPGNIQVVLTAKADSGYSFTGWSGGGCSGTSNCTVTMNAVKSVTATFASTAIDRTLTVSKTGNGRVTALGINCGTTCTKNYPVTSTVTLTAKADAGATFTGWGGVCSGAASTCTVTTDAVKNVTATFNP